MNNAIKRKMRLVTQSLALFSMCSEHFFLLPELKFVVFIQEMFQKVPKVDGVQTGVRPVRSV